MKANKSNFKKTYDQELSDMGFSAKQIYSLDATHIVLYKKITANIQKYFAGSVLDIGAGRDYFRTQAPNTVEKWTSLDYNFRTDSIDINASALDLPIKNACMDCVLLADVLEHLTNPEKAIGEIHRVLKNGGLALISAPFFLNLHEEPHDYFRFSKFGLKEVFERNGFEVVTLERTCGVISTMGYWITAALTKVFCFSSVMIRPVLFINKIFQILVLIPLDQVFDKRGRFAQGHIMIVKKHKDS
jgi:SAM-dependent methyltransferase